MRILKGISVHMINVVVKVINQLKVIIYIMESFIKNPNILLKLCFVFILYTPFVYSIDIKCFSVFDPREERDVLSEDVQSEYGVSYKKGTSIEWVIERESLLRLRFLEAEKFLIEHERETYRLSGEADRKISEDILDVDGVVYKKGARIQDMYNNRKRLDVKFPNRWISPL